MSISNALPFSWNIQHLNPGAISIRPSELRKHPRSKIERMKAGIRLNGFYLPIVVDAEGYAVTGCARVTAAIELGLATIPVLVHDQLTPAQIRAIRILDNKAQEGSSWNDDNLAAELQSLTAMGFDGCDFGFETAELDRLMSMSLAPASEEDEAAPKLPKTPITRAGDVWIVGEHRVISGDCRSTSVVERLMAGRTAAACMTDPPYNVRINGHVSGQGKHQHDEFAMASGEMSEPEFEAFLGAFLAETNRVVRAGGLIYAFMDWRGAHLITSAAIKLKLKHVNTCVWVKTNAGLGSLYRSQHEFALVFRKPGGKPVNNVQLGKFGRSRTNVWEYAGANSFGRTRDEDLSDHPTVKPIALIEDAIKDCTRRGDVVLDVFGGSGTTMLAAERCQRRAMLCEIDPGYVDVALTRFAKTFDIEAIHEATGRSFSQIAKDRKRERLAIAQQDVNTVASPGVQEHRA